MTEREQFEAHMRECGEDYLYRRDSEFSTRIGEYCRQNVQDQWQTWQAARATAEQSTEALYTMDQMREFADNFYLSQLQILVAEKEAYERHAPKADRDSVIEECAKVCDDILEKGEYSGCDIDCYQETADRCAKKIRALKTQQDAAIESQPAEQSMDSDDAKRYRWLRDIGDATWAPMAHRDRYCTASGIDAAIDAAIESQRRGDGS